ncbi:MAG: chromosomal replication initiator protein DnaA [Flavobacteriia bacterium]|nr:chromosomal replication initiator protein DnaA [Flavobacteriia bacterium]NBV67017.1 chromosomal replication initiator protein DnaA [Flavobacteriia bacterium]NBV90813.1 chromosomal replication initiator protein DnaA [Flavobacteriia bacterium]NBY40970.1 chromosomal replication initiator protein DnaA [Flavobacteriia bacterium]
MLKDHETTWKACLNVIKDNISLQAFKVWFEPIIPVKLEKSILTIQVPSHFFYEWLEQHYIGLLSKVIKKEIGSEATLEYSIVMESNNRNATPYTVKLPTQNSNATRNTPVNVPIGATEHQIRNPFIIPGLKKVNIESNLMPIFTFENFIEGDCNRLARASGYAVSNKPGGTAFNPLLIYGGVGLGKTHLAHAIGISIKEQHPNKTVLYVQSEKFAHQFIDAIKNQTTNDFIHFYQMMDVLIIDDVQFFAGKERTQDVFFSIFNHLHQNGKQIILTSDKAPVEMQGMEQRLLSRFKWGLSADLTIPDLETRIAILEKKMYGSGIELPKEVVEYLAYSINTNVREIEGALNTLLAQASLNKKSINLELAKQMVDKFVKNTAREVSIEYIQKIVCDYFDLPIEMLKSKTRKREVVQARQISMYFSKKMTKSSLANIGAHCGGKDHATVLHACRTVVNLSETDKQFRHYLDELEKKLTLH